MVCRDFILPEPASYVFLHALFNLRTYCTLSESGGTNVNVSWADRSVTWANGDINNNLNYTGFTHQVIALLDTEN